MAMRRSGLGFLFLTLLPLAACGRWEGPETSFEGLRRAIEARDGEAMFGLLSPTWQRLYVEWAEERFTNRGFFRLAGQLDWTPVQMQQAGPRGCLYAFLRMEGDYPYTPEFLREVRSLRTEWKAPYRAWVIAQPKRAELRPNAYEFILEGGQWYWRPPNLPPDFLRRRT